MRIINNIFRSLCYAGLVSNGIGMLVCVLNNDWENYSGEALGLAVWIGNYLYNKNKGNW